MCRRARFALLLVALVAVTGCGRAPGDPFVATHSTVMGIRGDADDRVGQVFTSSSETLAGVDVLMATFAGSARDGSVRLTLRDGTDGADLGVASVDTDDLRDPGWVAFRFDEPVPTPQVGSFELEYEGEGAVAVYANAPPDDIAADRLVNDPYAGGFLTVGGAERDGDLAFRVVAASGPGAPTSLRATVVGALRALVADPLLGVVWTAAMAGCVALAVWGLRRR